MTAILDFSKSQALPMQYVIRFVNLIYSSIKEPKSDEKHFWTCELNGTQ